MVHRQVATIAWFEADSACGSHSIAIPLVLVISYVLLLMQCLRQYKDMKEKKTLFNGGHVYRRLLFFSSVVDSLYSFY
ncbi:SPX and EXS domain-containing 3 [Gossypium australe]|uniref:SPX and EXS domain-containing 3 n=1 Tax=Gossypium australe TaxID=47621 RepID=A0A5B6VKP2_9ROSI|nr:SPX and EXS domain-containing 3 [Gossypium australe]